MAMDDGSGYGEGIIRPTYRPGSPLYPGGPGGGGSGGPPVGGGSPISPVASVGVPNRASFLGGPYDPRKRRMLPMGDTAPPPSQYGAVAPTTGYPTTGVPGTPGGSFNFNPNMQDPGLIAAMNIARRRNDEQLMRGRDEYGRAGMLGSSAMTYGMENQGRSGMEGLNDLTGQYLSNQRSEQLGEYHRGEDWAHQNTMHQWEVEAERRRMEAEQAAARSAMWGQLMGGIGNMASGGIYSYLNRAGQLGGH